MVRATVMGFASRQWRRLSAYAPSILVINVASIAWKLGGRRNTVSSGSGGLAIELVYAIFESKSTNAGGVVIINGRTLVMPSAWIAVSKNYIDVVNSTLQLSELLFDNTLNSACCNKIFTK